MRLLMKAKATPGMEARFMTGVNMGYLAAYYTRPGPYWGWRIDSTCYHTIDSNMVVTYNIGVNSYRYAFNGKEHDPETYGDGGEYDYGMRMYDPRLGRFLSIDPLSKKYPELTPYQFASNTPLQAIDLDGGEANNVTKNCHVKPNSTPMMPIPITVGTTNSVIYNAFPPEPSTISNMNPIPIPYYLTNVTEQNTTQSTQVEDWDVIGPVMKVTTTTTITSVDINMNSITGITVSKTSSTDYYPLYSYDDKTKTGTYDASNPQSYQAQLTTTVNKILLSDDQNKNLAKLSTGLKNQVGKAEEHNVLEAAWQLYELNKTMQENNQDQVDELIKQDASH
jgi:RHS repeat-associated protein